MPPNPTLAAGLTIAGCLLLACGAPPQNGQPSRNIHDPVVEIGPAENLRLPEPYATPVALKRPKIIGWPEGYAPVAPPGFRVNRFAEDLENPRSLYVLPNGDVLVAESDRLDDVAIGPSANRITLLRDVDQDGSPEVREVFLTGLNQPFGMLLLGESFYVANTDGLVRYPYRPGQTKISAPGEKILDLPAGGEHWTRNVIANADGSKLYVAVGSATNVDEERIDVQDERRAAILEVNPDGSQMRVFASGLRNAVGMDWEPETNTLWTVVNARGYLGDQLPPDYFTSVQEGAFYGWPYSYFGQYEDPRKKGERPDLVARAIVPDYALGAHHAPLGLVFYNGAAFPQQYRGGAFIAEHGSAGRANFVGYKVLFLSFQNGQPSGLGQDFLTGFIANEETSEVYGRPAGLAVLPDGSLLVSDDVSRTIWRVSAAEAESSDRSN